MLNPLHSQHLHLLTSLVFCVKCGVSTPETKYGLFMPENYPCEVRLIRARDLLAYLKHRLEGKQRQSQLCTRCHLSNDVLRRLRTRWHWCSGTDDLWSYSKVTLEFELSLWLKDQRQRTAQRANVNHVSNAELQKARNGLTTMLVNRRSKITS